jgi:hypothetical protein
MHNGIEEHHVLVLRQSGAGVAPPSGDRFRYRRPGSRPA